LARRRDLRPEEVEMTEVGERAGLACLAEKICDAFGAIEPRSGPMSRATQLDRGDARDKQDQSTFEKVSPVDLHFSRASPTPAHHLQQEAEF
jgi:hypothetical protein